MLHWATTMAFHRWFIYPPHRCDTTSADVGWMSPIQWSVTQSFSSYPGWRCNDATWFSCFSGSWLSHQPNCMFCLPGKTLKWETRKFPCWTRRACFDSRLIPQRVIATQQKFIGTIKREIRAKAYVLPSNMGGSCQRRLEINAMSSLFGNVFQHGNLTKRQPSTAGFQMDICLPRKTDGPMNLLNGLKLHFPMVGQSQDRRPFGSRFWARSDHERYGD